MQMSDSMTRLERQAWRQVWQFLWLAVGLAILGGLMFGPFGAAAGIFLAKALAKTDKIDLLG